MPLARALPENPRVKEVAWLAFNAHADYVGQRFAAFSARATIFLATGGINWAMACYSSEVDTEKLVALTHRATGPKADISKHGKRLEWRLSQNGSGHEASLRKGKFPPVKAALFFTNDKTCQPGAHELPPLES